MPEVAPHVLSWLYNILSAQYHEVDRTYQDVARVLQAYPLLKPQTRNFVYPTGHEGLLLLLDGLLPVLFRGQQYNFPINIWVPLAYPREEPIIYAIPTPQMVVNPGQHVDPNGQVYHPYLSNWKTLWDKSTLADFITILRDVFAKEPPLKAKEPGPSAPRPQAAPPPVPPLPPDLAPRPTSQVHSPAPPPPHTGQQQQRGPPPPPPKGAGEPLPQSHVSPAPSPLQQQGGASALPPLPPKPTPQHPPGHPPVAGSGAPSPYQHQQHASDLRQSQYGPPHPQGPAQASPRASRYDSAPPLPPQGRGYMPPGPGQQYPPPQRGYLPPPPDSYQQPPPPSGAYQQGPQPGASQAISTTAVQQQGVADPRRTSMVPPPQQQLQHGGPPPGWQPMSQPPKPKAPPPPDIMDADDLSLSIPTQSMTPPPIPPNPEKDMLLHQLGSTLQSMRITARSNMASSLAGLEAQKRAMTDARLNILNEMQNLTLMSQMLQSNTSILHSTMQQADQVIENSRAHPQPDIDSLLIAPTIVASQLYNLVAEERSLGDTVFMLGRAVERGRVAPNVFAKTTRSLARDWFLKKALIRKIGQGMALNS